MWPVYQAIKADPLSPLSRVTGGGFGAAYTPPPPSHGSAWPVTSSVYLFVDPRPFRHIFSMAMPTRSQGGSFERGAKMNNFLLHSSLIGVLGAEQSAPKYRRKFPEFRRAQEF
jgi:hypothetical protein